ncbi:MAG: 50S ribosomal protein L21 [Planctomycetota bacterium]
MYAIISDGSHQYRVEEGLCFDVQAKPDLDEGAKTIDFDRVLLLGSVEGAPKIGRPIISGARVICSVIGPTKGPKITIQKFKRRKKYALKKGHRQGYLRLRVDKIEG